MFRGLKREENVKCVVALNETMFMITQINQAVS